MKPYITASHVASRAVLTAYSTSFGLASRLFPQPIRQQIYDVYGLVRLADEIVDTYNGTDQLALLNDLEAETYRALERGYSTNIIVQAFVVTAQKVQIGRDLLQPFFTSMRMDINPEAYTADQYEPYIYGSAEVIGLMCLKVFSQSQASMYDELKPGAEALGAAFQKINFLRDIAADHAKLGRYYFPIGSFEAFDDDIKQQICDDIQKDIKLAREAVARLPRNIRRPVATAMAYYGELFTALQAMPAAHLKTQRPRISDGRKLYLLARTYVR